MKKLILLTTLLITASFSYAQFGGGSGTEVDPYRIYTKKHFEEFATEFNSHNEINFGDFTGIHLRLMNDITDTLRIMPSVEYSNPEQFYFNGNFHGGGHSINICPDSSDLYTVFSYIGVNGYIDSLNIVGTPYFFSSFVHINYGTISHCICDVHIEPPIAYDGFGYRAGISFDNFGSIEHCENYTNFTNAIHPETGWWDCTEFAGISYINEGSIRYCTNKGNMSSKEASIGGLVVYNSNNGIIEMCINSGDIVTQTAEVYGVFVGGISCYTQGNAIIRNCINMGNVQFLSTWPSGGIVYCAQVGTNLTNCLNSGKIYGYIDDCNIVRGAGIVGNGTDFNIAYCLNICKTGFSAIFDTSSNCSSINAINNYYDKQMCLSKGIAGVDIPNSAEGKLTTQLTGTSPELQAMLGDGWSYAEGRYPIPLGLENDSMALVAATPVYLHFENEEDYNHVDSVTKNFTVGLENNVSWDETNGRVSFSGEDVTLLNIGMETITVNLGEYSKKVRINILDTEVSNIQETITEKGIIIYPNPAGDYININLNGISANRIEICDIAGKVISSQFIATEHNQIHIGNLKSGMYLLKIYNKNQNVTTLRFVKN